MSSVDEKLRHILSKADRADKHIADLVLEVQCFTQSKPCGYSAVRASADHMYQYRVDSVRQPPVALVLIAGDAMQNLMCALDHLAFQITASDNPGDQAALKRKIYFPICEKPEDYASATKVRGSMPDASEATVEAFAKLRESECTAPQLSNLKKLNNLEKHRLLISALTRFSGYDIAEVERAIWRKYMSDRPMPAVMLQPAQMHTRACEPIRPGDVFLSSNVEIDKATEFQFDVLLFEPETVKPQPMCKALGEFATHVREVIAEFTPRLRST